MLKGEYKRIFMVAKESVDPNWCIRETSTLIVTKKIYIMKNYLEHKGHEKEAQSIMLKNLLQDHIILSK